MSRDFTSLEAYELAARGDLLGESWIEPEVKPAIPVTPPKLEGQPDFPDPGIYFGMPEEDYHAIHALSTSGIKRLSISSMDYWADSPLNPDPDEREQKDHFDFGNAIHCLVLEGEEAYRQRYVIGLDKGSIEGLLETTDDIKARIGVSGQKPVTKVPHELFGSRPAKKEDWIDQLLEIEPDAKVWERIKAEFDEDHEGAEVISHNIDRRVRIAARMIQAHPEISQAVTGGWPEVSVFWHCRATGAPMKARFDYLRADMIVDLKSFSNRGGHPIDRAIERTIASMRYNIQHAVYVDAAMEARRLVREKGADAIHSLDLLPEFLATDDAAERRELVAGLPEHNEREAWCGQWAAVGDIPEFMFIFQQTGKAPVTRGKIMPRQEMGVFGVTQRRVEELKRAFIANCEVYGADPWLDIAPVTMIDDDAFPMWATEF